MSGAWPALGLLMATAPGAEPALPARWEYSAPLVSPAPGEPHSVAVKDPSVIYHDGRWHLFMTIKTGGTTPIEYRSFARWSDADAAPRTILKVAGDRKYYCAPQVFYFRPQQRWYLLYQMGVPGRKRMQIAWSTTTNLAEPSSWTPAASLFEREEDDPRTEGGLDYWLICDSQRAYLFYTSNNGKLWRMSAPLDQFPHGFGHLTLALQGDLFEASHTYRLQGLNQYLTIVEANPGGKRYYQAYLADTLDGAWRPQAATWQHPFAGETNVAPAAGVAAWADNISHGELLREGADETMTIDPQHLRFVFQGVLERQKAGLSYGQFPWRIGLLTPR